MVDLDAPPCSFRSLVPPGVQCSLLPALATWGCFSRFILDKITVMLAHEFASHRLLYRSSQTASPGDTALRFGPLSLRLERDYEKFPLNRALRQILYELLYVQIPKKHKSDKLSPIQALIKNSKTARTYSYRNYKKEEIEPSIQAPRPGFEPGSEAPEAPRISTTLPGQGEKPAHSGLLYGS